MEIDNLTELTQEMEDEMYGKMKCAKLQKIESEYL